MAIFRFEPKRNIGGGKMELTNYICRLDSDHRPQRDALSAQDLP